MVQAPAAAGARWEMANFTNVFKIHISVRCKMKYSIKKTLQSIDSYTFKLTRKYFSWIDFIKKNNTTYFGGVLKI